MSGTASVLFTEILTSLAIVAGFVIAGKGLIFLIDRFIRKLTEKTATRLDDMLLAVVERPAFYLLVLWGLYVAFHRLRLEFGQGVFDIGDKVVFIIAVALVVKLVYDIINTLLEWYAVGSAEKGREEIGRTIIPLLKKLVKVFAVISGLIVVLDHFNYNISTLVAALGVSSLAVGLAAKDTLSNMISGFIIMADRPFRIGDRIESDGRVGDVVEIGLRSARIKTLDNNIVIIPNSKLIDNVLINHSYPENCQTLFYKLNVEYGSDVEKVKAVLLEAVKSVQEIKTVPAPEVLFVEYGDSAMVFQVICQIPEYRQRWFILDKLNTKVNRHIAEEGINIAYPTQTLFIQKAE